MGRRGTPTTPPKKRNRIEDGWALIGLYIQHDYVVTLKDPEIATALKWKTALGLPDDRRVRDVRAQVNNRAKKEQDMGLEVGDPRRVYAGWAFSYRDIKGSPSVLLDPTKSLNLNRNGIFALLGDATRLTQHSTERDRMAHWLREAAEAAVHQGDTDLGFAYLDAEHDMVTFGILRDVTLTRLRTLLERQP